MAFTRTDDPRAAGTLAEGPSRRGALLAAALIAAALAAGAAGLSLPAVAAVAAAASAALAAFYALSSFGDAPPAEAPLSGAMIALTDENGSLISASETFAAHMSQRGLPADPAALAVTPAAAAALFALRRAALTETSAAGVLPDGTLLDIAARDGRLVHRIAPPLAEHGAQDTDARLATAIVEAIPAPAAVADANGTVEAANEAFRAVIGDGNRLGEALVLEPDALARLRQGVAGRGTAQLDAPLLEPAERMVRLTAKPFANDSLLLCVTDITQQSALEARMAQSRKMQAIGQLAGRIAHDFNNVLTAIIGFSDLLLLSHRPSDPAFRDIMNIKQSAQRAAGLVKQLLAFSRRQTLQPTVLNLNEVLSDLSIMVERLIGEPVRLETNYGRDLWPVLADLSEIEQVIINLSVNARDAMPTGGTLTIRTSNVPRGQSEGEDDPIDVDSVLIAVEDVGTGMPSHVLEKIFEPFFTTKATGEGTGLGLSSVYGIVNQTGGTLTVASKEGEGTTFRVYLPRASAERVPEPEPKAASGTPADLTGNATLLLVEDEEAIRTIAQRALAAKGYRVLPASSGVEALEIFAEEGGAIDLLLTDVIMPELDGPGLVEKVRAQRPDMKVIFMSGYADGASVEDLGGARFLPKPFTLKALAEIVKAELAS